MIEKKGAEKRNVVKKEQHVKERKSNPTTQEGSVLEKWGSMDKKPRNRLVDLESLNIRCGVMKKVQENNEINVDDPQW